MKSGEGSIVHCWLENRDQLIEDYLQDRLSEAQREEFDVHLYECEQCFGEVEFREDTVYIIKKRYASEGQVPEIITMPETISKSENRVSFRWVGAVAAIFIAGIFILYWTVVPPHDQLAQLSDSEQKSLQTQVRRPLAEEATHYTRGAALLLEARKEWLGLIPYYDDDILQEATAELLSAHEVAYDPFESNKIAYFIGKAYLMADEIELCRAWLERVVNSGVAAYRDEAQLLLDRLSE